MITTFQRPVAIAARASPWFQWSSRLKPPKVIASYSSCRPRRGGEPGDAPGQVVPLREAVADEEDAHGRRIGRTG